MTHVIVLAAGLGRRLQLDPVVPKWLAPVGSTTPMAAQLDAFEAADLRSVTVVCSPGPTGHGAISDLITPWRSRLDIEFLVNERYTELNNWYSLLLGLQRHAGEPVLVANSDLFATTEWLAEAAKSLLAADAPAALVVDEISPVTDESMKVSASSGSITGIGKVGIDPAAGEYVGLSCWSDASATELHQHLAGFVGDDDCSDNWYEHGIQAHIGAGAPYRLVGAPSPHWVEIDNAQDLVLAQSLAPDTDAP